MPAPGAEAVLFPFGDVLMGKAGMAEVSEVFGDLFEGDAFGDPFADLVTDGEREMGDFAARFAVGGGIAEVGGDWEFYWR